MNTDERVRSVPDFVTLVQWMVAIQFLGIWQTCVAGASLDTRWSVDERDFSDAPELAFTTIAPLHESTGPLAPIGTHLVRSPKQSVEKVSVTFNWVVRQNGRQHEAAGLIHSEDALHRTLSTVGAAMLCLVSLVAWKKGWFIPKESLHVAAKSGRIQDAARLTERGASVNAIDGEGHSPMYYAARAGHYGMVKLLRDAGANPNLSDAPLIQAIGNGHTKVARMLLLNGARTDVKGTGGETPLMAAARRTDPYMITLLLDKRANVYEKDSKGWTALFAAIDSRDAGTVSRLVGAGSRMDATALDGTTPLMLAVTLVLEDIVGILLNAGADPNARKTSGSSPVSEAILQNNPGMLKMLFDAGADLSKDIVVCDSGRESNATGSGDHTITENLSPHDLAVHHGHHKVAVFIKKQLARKNTVTGDILAAIDNNEYDNVKAMLKKKPRRIHRLSKDTGWGVLHLAVKNHDPKMVKLLLRYGAEVDQKNDRGKTPLHQAAERGDVAIVGLLLQKGANPLDPYKKALPSDRAAERGHTKAAKLIRSYLRGDKTT